MTTDEVTLLKHEIHTLEGRHVRLTHQCVYELDVALRALRKGALVVTEQRLELVLEMLRKQP